MKFDDKYPDAEYLEQYEFEGSFIIKDKYLGSCCICKSDTYCMDVSLQAYICSEECDREMWRIYSEEVKRDIYLHGYRKETE